MQGANLPPFPQYPRNSHTRRTVWGVHVANPLTGSRPTQLVLAWHQAGPPWRSKSQVTSLGEWAEQGLTGITIVNPKGESYDIDRFGMIVSTTQDDLHADQT